MKKEKNIRDLLENQHKTTIAAILLAGFGVLLFIALALTLPQ